MIDIPLPERVFAADVYLRRFQPSDHAALLEYHADPEVVRLLPWPVRTPAQVQSALEKDINEFKFEEEGDFRVWALIRKEDEHLIGEIVVFYRSAEHQHAELGYVINPAFAGLGYMTQGCKVVIDALFATGLFHRVFARLDARNERSEALLIRLGMRKEGHQIEDDLFKGEWTDTIIYATLQSEWKNKSL